MRLFGIHPNPGPRVLRIAMRAFLIVLRSCPLSRQIHGVTYSTLVEVGIARDFSHRRRHHRGCGGGRGLSIRLFLASNCVKRATNTN